MKTSTPYTLVHTVYSLCQVILHREYVPFIPIRCKKPEGPLDPPMFPPNKYHVPAGFWDDSARECFRSARDIMDLVRSCQEWNALVETPIIGFAIYTVAFVGVYCINFPWMDKDGYMCTQPSSASAVRPDGSKTGESKGFEAARKALMMLGQMSSRLHMADGWFRTINRMHKYFRRMKSDYSKNVKASDSGSTESDDSPTSGRHLSLREGGAGGGLDEFRLLERTLADFGNLEDSDIQMTDAGPRPSSRALDAVYDDSNSGTTVKSEEMGERAVATTEPPRSEGGPWNAINTAPGAIASRQPSLSTPSSAQFRSYESYPPQLSTSMQQPQQQSQPNYAHQINNFRPVHAHDTPAPSAGPPPSLTSPASHSTSTASQPSPPFDRQNQQQQQQPPYGNGWTPQNTTYPMQPPQTSYTNGISHHAQQPTPMHSMHSYSIPAPTHPVQHQHQLQPGPPMPDQPHQLWDSIQKEAWLNSLDTRLGGDDLAAFAEGGELTDWVTMSAARGYNPGWLSAIWGGAQG